MRGLAILIVVSFFQLAAKMAGQDDTRWFFQRAAILTTDNTIRHAHLVNIIDPSHRTDDFAVPRTGDELKRIKKAAREKSVEEIEKQFVLEALKRNQWNVTKSAEDTGMQRPNFQALMKKYTIRVRDSEHEVDGD